MVASCDAALNTPDSRQASHPRVRLKVSPEDPKRSAPLHAQRQDRPVDRRGAPHKGRPVWSSSVAVNSQKSSRHAWILAPCEPFVPCDMKITHLKEF